MAGGLWAYLSCYHQCPPRRQLASNGCTGSAYRKHMRCNLYPQTDRMTGQSQGSDKRVRNQDHLGELTGHWLRSQRGQVQELTTSCHNPCCAAAVVDWHTWHYNDCAHATSTGSSDLTLDLVASKEKKILRSSLTGMKLASQSEPRGEHDMQHQRSQPGHRDLQSRRRWLERSTRCQSEGDFCTRAAVPLPCYCTRLAMRSRQKGGRDTPRKRRANSTCKQAKQKKRRKMVCLILSPRLLIAASVRKPRTK
ncbi:hypothetical protein BJ166DRAFT_543076 [Pestalotiopsis sp. NC0098]|nr:hypothetical protein BJ166DRAFT_543076 [Pestalotiopsis sp. NC0098]